MGELCIKVIFFVYGGDLIRDCFFNVDDYVGGNFRCGIMNIGILVFFFFLLV